MIRCVKVDPLAYAAADTHKYWDPFVEKKEKKHTAKQIVRFCKEKEKNQKE